MPEYTIGYEKSHYFDCQQLFERLATHKSPYFEKIQVKLQYQTDVGECCTDHSVIETHSYGYVEITMDVDERLLSLQ